MHICTIILKKVTMIFLDCDYMQGAHPRILEKLQETNMEATVGYGQDDYCRRAKELIKKACGQPEAEVHFLVGGTQTNATVIDAILARHEGVIAAETGHINVHESGAIEACGHKILALPHHEGKLCAEEVEEYINNFYADETYEHMVAPGMVYISNPTEYGTLYSYEELLDLSTVCSDAGIPLFMDGARLGYGLASPDYDVTLEDIARLCDVFYIGGTKVGALFGEAVVCRRPEILGAFFPLIKQHGALLAKGRLLGLQFETLFTDGLYFKIAAHAVQQAMRIKQAMADAGYKAYINSPTNQQFFKLPNSVIDQLAQWASFEYWGPRGAEESVIRMVTSWATDTTEVTDFIEKIKNTK